MTSASVVTLVVGVLAFFGTLLTLKGTLRNSDVDVMKQLREATEELVQVRQENSDLKRQINKLQDTVDDLKDELKKINGGQNNNEN